MSIALALTLAAVSTVQPSCSWDRPGANPYTGNSSAAIDRYTDIPEGVRAMLKHRMSEGLSDDTVHITRDAIVGHDVYNPEIHDMHFGAASVCHSVTRSKWTETRSELAAVYCVKDHCILVPKICGNVSRISRLQAKTAKFGKPPATAAMPPDFDAVELNPLGMLEQALGPDGTPAEMSEEELAKQARDKRNHMLTSLGELGEPGQLSDINPEFDLSAAQYALQNPDSQNDLDDMDAAARRARSAGTGVGLGHGQFPNGTGSDNGDVIAAPVPEADTWAMLLSGLGMLGFVARRKRARRAAGNAA